MKKIFYFLLFSFILLIPIIYAEQTATLNNAVTTEQKFRDTFLSTQLITADGDWIQSVSGCVVADAYVTPIPSVFGSFGAGVNRDMGACTSIRYIKSDRSLIPGVTNGTMFVDVDLASLRDDVRSSEDFSLQFTSAGNGTGSVVLTVNIDNDAEGTITGVSVGAGGEDCTLNLGLYEEYLINVKVELNVDTNEYSIFVNDQPSTCFQQTTSIASVGSFLLYILGDSDVVHRYMDNFEWNIGYLNYTVADCPYPKVFCDDFDYTSAISPKWDVLNLDNSINNSFFPQEKVLNWTETEPLAIGYYEIDQFQSDYQLSETTTTTGTIYSPVMSIDYDLKQLDNSGLTYFRIDDVNGQSCLDFQIGNNITLTNGTFLTDLANNSFQNFKISAFFGDLNKAGVYPFNSTIETNYFQAWLDGTTLGVHSFNDQCRNLYTAFFIKDTVTSQDLHLDNYSHYVGLDESTEVVSGFFTELYTDQDQVSDVTTGDAYEEIQDLYDLYGFTTATRFLAGIFLLFIFVLGMIFYSAKAGSHLPIPIYFIVTFVFMIMEVYLRLLPFWIPLLMVIVGAGIGAIAVKNSVNG